MADCFITAKCVKPLKWNV